MTNKITPAGGRPKVLVGWSKKESDWLISWPDNAGKALSHILFDMLRTKGQRVDWGKDLISLLNERGYDPTTFKITVSKKLPPNPLYPLEKRNEHPSRKN